MGEDTYILDIFSAMKKNLEFLKQNAERFYDEILELVNDPIKCLEDIADAFGIKVDKKDFNDVIRAAETDFMIFYIHNVLYPTTISAHINILIGNLPGFCRDLRFLIESLAKSYWADIKHAGKHLFEKWKIIDESKMRDHEFVKELDRELGMKRATKLWGKLSEEIHFKGYIKRVEKSFSTIGMPPSWALTIPCEYWEGDMDEIFETFKGYHEFVCEFREIFQIIWKKYIEKLKNNSQLQLST
ncbi:hypothetical protein KEJ37_00395 [Candidatus Bathyarchaeota archaeon]|nr:hypothetical protein [Candidatus Bathyarchaeota archaeon]